MKITLSKYEMADMLRADNNAAWSYYGARALAEWLDDNRDEDEEFEIVAIRCDWSEHASAVEAAEQYGWERDDDDEEAEKHALEWLTERTIVIDCPQPIIIQNF